MNEKIFAGGRMIFKRGVGNISKVRGFDKKGVEKETLKETTYFPKLPEQLVLYGRPTSKFILTAYF